MESLRIQRICNPNGIVSPSPGLRGTSYPGSRARRCSTPTGLHLVSSDAPQPRWGCGSVAGIPRVARSSQPWALRRNPFGIQLWNLRKAFGIGIVGFLLAAVPLAHALERPGVEFKIFQFPPDQIPRIDGQTDDWAMVPKDYIIGMDQLSDTVGGRGTNYNRADLDVQVRVI